MTKIKTNFKGMGLCFIIAIPAWLLGSCLPLVGGPVFSIMIGALTAVFIKNREQFNPGISFTSKKILQYAIVLLGFGMNLSVIIATGIQSLPIILSTIIVALLTAFLLYKLLKMPTNISILVGIGSSICGGSAIAATAPVIGADDEEIAQSISVIFFFNILAALIFPTLGGFLGLSDYGFGLFAGTAVNDTSSVTAAAAAWDAIHNSQTLGIAAVVKLTRTLAIIPITLILAIYRVRVSRSQSGERIKISKLFPFFILYFIAASIITTLCIGAGVPREIFQPLKNLSRFFILMAMAAIGLNTNVIKLIRSGGKPLLMGLCCWIAIASVSLIMQKIIGIW